MFANYTTSFTRIVVQTEAQANGDWARLGGKFKEHWDFLSRYALSALDESVCIVLTAPLVCSVDPQL